jgi:membrane dipeptidase
MHRPFRRRVTELGAKLIGRLDELGVIVDVAHCSEQTIIDACKLSQRPVVVSHTGAAAQYRHDRGISDGAAQAIAATGGVTGVVAVPFFLGAGESSVETMLDHIDHFVRVAGWEHVAIATDWPMCAPKWTLKEFENWAMTNGFRPEHGIVATQNLVGFDDYRDFPNITRGLVSRGYGDEQVRGILGENFLRVFTEVCG